LNPDNHPAEADDSGVVSTKRVRDSGDLPSNCDTAAAQNSLGLRVYPAVALNTCPHAGATEGAGRARISA